MLLDAPRRRGGRAWVPLVIGLLIGGSVGAGTVFLLKREKGGIPGGPRLGKADELALIPADAMGFVHVRVRDVWKSEHLTELRKIVEKAGPEALTALDENFVPSPSTLDRLTVVFMQGAPANKMPPGGFPPDDGGGDLLPGLGLPLNAPRELQNSVVVLSFTAPYAEEKVRGAYLRDPKQMTAGGNTYWADAAPGGMAVYSPSSTVLVLGGAAEVRAFVGKQSKDGKQPTGPLTRSLEWAAEGGRHLVAAVNLKSFGPPNPKMFDGAPEDVKAIAKDLQALMKAEAVGLGIGLAGDDSKIDVRASYATDDEAAAADAAIKPVAEFARKKLQEPRQMLLEMVKGKPGQAKPRPIRELPMSVMGVFGLGALNTLDDYLANPPVKRDGNELAASFDKASGGAYVGVAAVSVGLLLPAVQKVREAASRMQGANNLKQIGIGFHNYFSVYDGRMPSPFDPALPNPGPNARPLLSWRVHLLPFIEQEALYREFRLNEPWDSPHNRPLIDKMPKVYLSPNAPPAGPGMTYYKVIVGGGAMFDPQFRNRFPASITDGTSMTIMTVEGGSPVIWTKPEDITFNGTRVPDLSLAGNTRINVGMGDGSVRTIDLRTISPQSLRAAITANAGDIPGPDW